MEKQELNTARIKCLRCDKLFDSRDRCANRICKECTKIINKEYIPRIAAVRHSGLRLPDADA